MCISLAWNLYDQKVADVATVMSQGRTNKDVLEMFKLSPTYFRKVMHKGQKGAGLPHRKRNYIKHADAIQKNLALWKEYSAKLEACPSKMRAIQDEYSSKITHLNQDYYVKLEDYLKGKRP